MWLCNKQMELLWTNKKIVSHIMEKWQIKCKLWMRWKHFKKEINQSANSIVQHYFHKALIKHSVLIRVSELLMKVTVSFCPIDMFTKAFQGVFANPKEK